MQFDSNTTHNTNTDTSYGLSHPECHFARLPLELRLRIYQYHNDALLTTVMSRHVDGQWITREPRSVLENSNNLAMTCRQLRDEHRVIPLPSPKCCILRVDDPVALIDNVIKPTIGEGQYGFPTSGKPFASASNRLPGSQDKRVRAVKIEVAFPEFEVWAVVRYMLMAFDGLDDIAQCSVLLYDMADEALSGMLDLDRIRCWKEVTLPCHIEIEGEVKLDHEGPFIEQFLYIWIGKEKYRYKRLHAVEEPLDGSQLGELEHLNRIFAAAKEHM